MIGRRQLCSAVLTVAVVCSLLIGAGGCANNQRWYHQGGKGQVDYERDAQECGLIAQEFARQATMSGTAEDPITYQRTWQSCLAGKGWSTTPPPAPGETAPAGQSEPLAVTDGAKMRVFGRAEIALPANFTVANRTTGGVGPSVMENFFFGGPHGTYITVLAQRTVAAANRFEETPYPVLSPFFLYEQKGGQASPKGGQWAVFCGLLNNEWVVGVGSYFLVSETERATVIVTRPLIAPQAEPEPGFRLSREQFAAVEAFKAEWLPWLADSVTLPSPSLWSRLPHPW